MSTTTPRALKAGHDVRLEPIYAWYVEALGDEDKAGTIMDCNYYTGLREAYENVLDTLGALEPSSADETENWVNCSECTYLAFDEDDLAEHVRRNPDTHTVTPV